MKKKKEKNNFKNKQKMNVFLYILYYKIKKYLLFFSFPIKIRKKINKIINEFLIYIIPSNFMNVKEIDKKDIAQYCKEIFGESKKQTNYYILRKFSSLFNKYLYLINN